MAWAWRCTELGGAAAACVVEKLAAVGGKRWVGAAGESVPDGMFSGDERSDFQLLKRAVEPGPVVALHFTAVSADLLGVDGGLCGRRTFARNIVGERARVRRALLVLPVEMAWAWTFRVTAADLFRSGAVGHLARSEGSAARPKLGIASGSNGDAYTFAVGQGRMGVWMLAIMAGVVSGSDSRARAVGQPNLTLSI